MTTQSQQNAGEIASVVSQNAATVPVSAAISTVSKNLKLSPGQWKVSILDAETAVGSTPAARRVFLKAGADNTVAATAVSDTAHQGDATGNATGWDFRGDEIERIEVTSANPWIAFILSAGAAATKINLTRMGD